MPAYYPPSSDPGFGGTSRTWLSFTVPDVLTVRSGFDRFTFPVSGTISGVAISVGTAPTGSSIIVDVKKNGTTIYTTAGNRPTIAASAFASTETAPDITSFSAGDFMTFDIVQVGSTVAGANLIINVRVVT